MKHEIPPEWKARLNRMFPHTELLRLIGTPTVFLEIAYDYADSVINILITSMPELCKKECREIRRARREWEKNERHNYDESGRIMRERSSQTIQRDASQFFNRMYSDYRKETGLQFPKLRDDERIAVATAECSRSLIRVCRKMFEYADLVVLQRTGWRGRSFFPVYAGIIYDRLADIIRRIAGSCPTFHTAPVHEGSLYNTLSNLDFEK